MSIYAQKQTKKTKKPTKPNKKKELQKKKIF